MKVYIYIRVSTDSQTESGAGLAAQRDACQKWTEEKNMIINRIFSEEGVSGSTGLEKRPALMDAINHLEKGDILLISRRDRLGRDVIHVAMIEAAINRKNAHIVSIAGEGTDGNDSSSVLMRRMIDAFAEFERNIICERTKAAMQAKKRRNERVGHIPFGLRLSEDGIHLEGCPEEMFVLTQIQELKNRGFSTRKTATEMNNRKSFNRGESRWNHGSMHRMFKKIAA